MNIIFSIFNAREQAIIIWLVTILILGCFNQKIRESLFSFFKILFSFKVLLILLLMALYGSLMVLILYKLNLWDFSLLKNTIIYGIGIGIVMLMNYERATKEQYFFKSVVFQNLKITLLLDFIINLYVFSLFAELVLLPIITLISCLAVVAGSKKEYTPVKKVMDFILASIGIYFILNAGVNIATNFQAFATIHNLKDFLIIPLFSVIYTPFVYIFAVIAGYEVLFKRIDIFMKDNSASKRRFAKLELIKACKINIKLINRFYGYSIAHFRDTGSKSDILNHIRTVTLK